MPNNYHNTEEINKYLHSTRYSDVEMSFDEKYSDRLNKLYESSVRLFNGIQEAANQSDQGKFSDGTINAIFVCWKSLKMALASVQLLRAGYIESPSILRDSLEMGAIALTLHEDPKSNDLFRLGKSLYNQGLAKAYLLIPSFKTSRQLLSELFVHPSSFSGVVDIKNGKFSMVGLFDDSMLHRYENSLMITEIMFEHLSKIIEYIFFDYFEPAQFWTRDADGKMSAVKPTREYLDRIIATAVLVKENTGIDWFADAPGDTQQDAEMKLLLRNLAAK